jgi:hypothetical protein
MLNPVAAGVVGGADGGWLPNAFEPTAQKARMDNNDGRYIKTLRG